MVVVRPGCILVTDQVSEGHLGGERILEEHVEDVLAFYGMEIGRLVARKHIGWYTKGLPGSAAFRESLHRAPDLARQREVMQEYFRRLLEEPAEEATLATE